MDSMVFYLLLVVALIDVVFSAWFIRQGLRARRRSSEGHSQLFLGGMMLVGAIFLIAVAFLLFPPFG
jgi:hypothetical protein